MGCTLLSGGCSEHRLPAAVCKDGRSQLHPLDCFFIVIAMNIFSQFLEPGLSNYVSNSGNTKEVVTGPAVSQLWQRVNTHQYTICTGIKIFISSTVVGFQLQPAILTTFQLQPAIRTTFPPVVSRAPVLRRDLSGPE
jgi:hypothetical protein